MSDRNEWAAVAEKVRNIRYAVHGQTPTDIQFDDQGLEFTPCCGDHKKQIDRAIAEREH